MEPSTKPAAPPAPKIWWANAAFFLGIHFATILGIYWYPPTRVSKYSLWLCFWTWQLADFGITIGYHRLYSHRSFRASLVVRVILAALGSAAFQGSIKWWCLRHRLHHRFTDDLVHDPYAATRGLLYSHMGWIFFKPDYSRMSLVDREDLNSDPVVVLQHKLYIPLALLFGFALPCYLGSLWGDVAGAFVWGGLLARLLIWHATFCVNSLAHWDGLQPYSDDDTSRGNLLLALLTCGEGSHNFHTFPFDYRAGGPSKLAWDPSKWTILTLETLGLISHLRRANPSDVKDAHSFMMLKHDHGDASVMDDKEEWIGETWTEAQAQTYIEKSPGACLILLDGYLLDATKYMKEHPGGASILRQYSVRKGQDDDKIEFRDAAWAFHGGLNNHGSPAVRKMRGLRVSRLEAN